MKELKGITIKIGGETTLLQNALKDIDKTSYSLQAELKKVNQLLKFDPENATLVAQKQELLTKSIEETKKKVDALKQAQAEVEAQFKSGAISDEAYRDFQREVVQATNKLDYLEKQLKDTEGAQNGLQTETKETKNDLQKLETQTAQNTDKLDKMRDIISKTGGHMTSLRSGISGGTAAFAAMAAAAIAAAAGITKVITKSTEAASEIRKQSDVTGQSTERIQELTYVGKQLDISYDTLIKAQQKLTQGMNSARLGGEKQTEAFKALGIEIKNNDGSLRDSKVVMMEAFDALGKMGNATERDALSLSIFGKSAMELNPLIKAGSAEISKFSEEAHKVGAVMSEQTIKALDDLGDTIDATKMSLQGVVGTLMQGAAPALQEMLGKVQLLAQSFSDGLTSGDMAEFNKQLSTLTTDVVNGITNGMPGLLEAAGTIIKALAEGIVTNMPTIIKSGVDILLSLVTSLTAPETMLNLVGAAVEIMGALLDGIIQATPIVLPAMFDLMIALVDKLTEEGTLGKLIGAAVQIIVYLAAELVTAIPMLVARLPEILKSIVDYFTSDEGKAAMKQAGNDLMDSLGDGMKIGMGDLMKWITNSKFAKAMFKLLGIEIDTEELKRMSRDSVEAAAKDRIRTSTVITAGPINAPLNSTGQTILANGIGSNKTVNVTVNQNAPVVGSNGMNEFVGIVERTMANNLALNGG